MNRQQHLMIRAMEECNEVAQRISKALVFGLEQVQKAADDKPEQNPLGLNNSERIIEEYNDLVALMEMAGFPLSVIDGRKLDAKREKVEKYLKMSQQLGTLDSPEYNKTEPEHDSINRRYPLGGDFHD